MERNTLLYFDAIVVHDLADDGVATIFVGKVEFGECDALVVIFQEAKILLITRADANNVSGST